MTIYAIWAGAIAASLYPGTANDLLSVEMKGDRKR